MVERWGLNSPDQLDREIYDVGKAIAEALPRPSRSPLQVIDRRVNRLVADDAALRAALFRFVDVMPACDSPEEVVEHFVSYLVDLPDLPMFLRLGRRVSAYRVARPVVAAFASAAVRHLARRFIVGESPADAARSIEALWLSGIASSVDLLGEATVTEAEADAYEARCKETLEVLTTSAARFPPRPSLETDSIGALPRVNLSVKISALTPRLRPQSPDLGIADAMERLRRLLGLAHRLGAHLHVDMESLDTREAILLLGLGILGDTEYAAGPSLGLVVQAYLRDSPSELDQILTFANEHVLQAPLVVRLVKGAYWDHEVTEARQRGWAAPVFLAKAESDANFEALTRRLLEARPTVRVAIASHNLRSISHALAYNRHLGGRDEDVELQVLRGLGDDLAVAVRSLGYRVRVYSPIGDLVAGMAYLVRRLLENTSNESFLRERARGGSARSAVGGAVSDLGTFANEPLLELRRADVRDHLTAGFERSERAEPIQVPIRIGDGERFGGEIASLDPGAPDRVVALSASATRDEVDEAVATAADASRGWASRPVGERATALLRAAAWLRSRRLEVAALEVRECAKPWLEADADVCEAIDYLEYYARAAFDLDRGGSLLQVPGERNELVYAGRGVVAVIAPWNFPVAIPMGMTAAAVVSGNAAILKPAEQSPACGAVVVDALRAGGVPDAVVALLPGDGGVGAALVSHRDVAVIAFTGSLAVGLEVVRAAAEVTAGQRQLKRVVAEFGGKNCIIVERDADLDDAVPAIIASAFSYAGQKCSAASRVLVADRIADRLLERLGGAASVLVVGQAREFSTEVPPVIEEAALERILRYAKLCRSDGEILAEIRAPESPGYFASPLVVGGLPADSPVLHEEIFGPILAVERFNVLEEAIARIEELPFALTAGLFSRDPRTIAAVTSALSVGNLYVNRAITGAMVGRQPFGGNRLSGNGTKAGGPDYLKYFTDPKVVSENTERHGLVV